MGAAIGKLKPGYLRVPFNDGVKSDAVRGPFRDKLDPKWELIMFEAYERIAEKESPWLTGQFLTEKHFPKASGSRLRSIPQKMWSISYAGRIIAGFRGFA